MWLKSIFLIFCLNSAFTSAQVVTISCNFRQSGADYPYTCDLTLINPNGLDNFDNIQGDHLESRGNDDVTLVNAYNQNSPIVPSIICRQFPNLRTLYLSNCNIQTINETAFAGCANLEQIMLSFNGITEIPAFTFRNSPNLEFLFFR